ncbi:hypothetical protein IPH25_03595 [bacterium]|nr:MAG: hypothetical protein IPG37_00585 [bacterium]QQR61538.1 MAG: hypothetical protein IPH25_03595 [bacterium]QQR62933.1 MAG: hypothetical protein IPH67_00385 [bacterium]
MQSEKKQAGCIQKLSFLWLMLLLGGCKKKTVKRAKNSESVAQLFERPILFQDIPVPFGAYLFHAPLHPSLLDDMAGNSQTGVSEVVAMKMSVPSQELAVFCNFYKDAMEQLGWILLKSVITQTSLLFEFQSVTRACIIIADIEQNLSGASIVNVAQLFMFQFSK